MLKQFRHLYPQGSILSELINIDRGLYIVKVSVQNQQTILGTGLAAAETVEKAEDKARERALMTISLTKPESTPISSEVTQFEPITPPTLVKVTQEITQPVEKTHDDNSYNSSAERSSTREQVVAKPLDRLELEETEDFAALETEAVIVETNSASEPQINLFDQPIIPTSTEETSVMETDLEKDIAAETTIELDFNEIRHKIDLEMKRLNWTKEEGRDFLVNTYGKRSRLHLTDEELLEFWHYLETLPN
jgi:hypothetical protein